MNPAVRMAAVLLLVLAAGAPLYAVGTVPGDWFRTDPLAAAYSGVESDVSAVFADAERAGVPSSLLMDKLQEGASKSVAPDRLVEALRAEADRLATAQAAITRSRIRLAGTEERSDVLRAISLLMVSGVRDATVESLLAASPGKRNPADIVDALNVLVQIRLSTGLPDSEMQVLGTALLRSGLPRAAFPALPGVLFNAAARGMSDEVAATVLADVLGNGGGILQMEDALQKRADADAAAASAAGANGTPGGSGSPGGNGSHGGAAGASSNPGSARSGGASSGASGGPSPQGQAGSGAGADHRKTP